MDAISEIVLGLDEVGRGCWAGPLVAGAVILGQPIPGLKDSKRLTPKQRETLNVLIRRQALAYGLGWVEPREVDALGMTESVRFAFHRARAALKHSFDRLVIDGNINYFPEDARSVAIIKADACVPAVSAASILAKVARDHYMIRAASSYPAYGFERHAGYGTAQHREALAKNGVCALHRHSFRPVQAYLRTREAQAVAILFRKK